MKPYALNPAYSKGSQAPFVLEPAERPLNGRTAPVEALPAQRLAGDQGMKAISFDPLGPCSTLFCGTTPLCSTPFVVRSSESPLAMLACRGFVLTALHGRGFTQRDHWSYFPCSTSVIHSPIVIALVHRTRLGVYSERVQLVQQGSNSVRFVRACSLYTPGERKVCCGTNRHMETIAIESATLAGGDSGAVAPGGIGVGVLLTFRSVLRLEALPIGICRHIRSIYCDILAYLRVLFLQLFENTSNTSIEQIRVLAELRCEAIAGPMRRNLAVRGDHSRESRVLPHKRHRACPARE